MADAVTRPEFEAKLEAMEARQEANISRLEGRFATLEATISSLANDVRAVTAAVGKQGESVTELRRHVDARIDEVKSNNLAHTITAAGLALGLILTIIGTGVALYYGWAQAAQTMLSAVAEGRQQAAQPAAAPQPIIIQIPSSTDRSELGLYDWWKGPGSPSVSSPP
ncbi:hypothetical protein [Geminicoccus harenae]|uniref:hypothetical protein n=1 Tax=Geminicoccus harenae TaxID=2498453 RepID=UPI00168A4659|nr:hypothetical protein [Geminicoccus harenae]